MRTQPSSTTSVDGGDVKTPHVSRHGGVQERGKLAPTNRKTGTSTRDVTEASGLRARAVVRWKMRERWRRHESHPERRTRDTEEGGRAAPEGDEPLSLRESERKEGVMCSDAYPPDDRSGARRSARHIPLQMH